MSDDREIRPGFLPPRAPGSGQPSTLGGPEMPRWQPPGPPATGERPRFVQGVPVRTGPIGRISIALAVIGLLVLVVTVGVGWWLALPMAGLALALAYVDRSTAAASGDPHARTALTLAWIALALAALAAIVWISLASSGITPEDLERWLEDELRRRQDSRDSPGEPA